MSHLPPTLRTNRRYVLVRIDPAGIQITPKDLHRAISDAVTSLWGDSGASGIQPAVIWAEGGYAIIRCIRGKEADLVTALATITSCQEAKIALRSLATSGTIKSLRDKIRGAPETGAADESSFLLRGKEWVIMARKGSLLDLIEKGYKNTELLFFTEEELDNLKE